MTIQPSTLERIDKRLRSRGVPGCSIAALQGGVVTTAEIGIADLVRSSPVTPRTVFHYFSGTKLYTATAVALLHERGLVDLDAPVTAYLRGLELTYPVTARALLSHRSGLPETLSAFLAVHLDGRPTPSAAAALERYRTTGGKRPGGKAVYRNVDYAILGALIAEVSGTSYVDFVTREVLDPLGSGAAFDYSEATREHAAVGYVHRLSPMRWLLRFMDRETSRQLERDRVGSRVALAEFGLDTAAIGGLIGTASDFVPLLREMLDPNDGLLQADTKREMLTLQSAGRAGIASKVGVGLGWKRGDDFWNHEGGGGGFTSETRIYPEDRLGVVLLMNTTQSSKLSWLAHELCELLRAAD